MPKCGSAHRTSRATTTDGVRRRTTHRFTSDSSSSRKLPRTPLPAAGGSSSLCVAWLLENSRVVVRSVTIASTLPSLARTSEIFRHFQTRACADGPHALALPLDGLRRTRACADGPTKIGSVLPCRVPARARMVRDGPEMRRSWSGRARACARMDRHAWRASAARAWSCPRVRGWTAPQLNRARLPSRRARACADGPATLPPTQ